MTRQKNCSTTSGSPLRLLGIIFYLLQSHVVCSRNKHQGTKTYENVCFHIFKHFVKKCLFRMLAKNKHQRDTEKMVVFFYFDKNKQYYLILWMIVQKTIIFESNYTGTPNKTTPTKQYLNTKNAIIYETKLSTLFTQTTKIWKQTTKRSSTNNNKKIVWVFVLKTNIFLVGVCFSKKQTPKSRRKMFVLKQTFLEILILQQIINDSDHLYCWQHQAFLCYRMHFGERMPNGFLQTFKMLSTSLLNNFLHICLTDP